MVNRQSGNSGSEARGVVTQIAPATKGRKSSELLALPRWDSVVDAQRV
jgi:hypothetical protein